MRVDAKRLGLVLGRQRVRSTWKRCIRHSRAPDARANRQPRERRTALRGKRLALVCAEIRSNIVVLGRQYVRPARALQRERRRRRRWRCRLQRQPLQSHANSCRRSDRCHRRGARLGPLVRADGDGRRLLLWRERVRPARAPAGRRRASVQGVALQSRPDACRKHSRCRTARFGGMALLRGRPRWSRVLGQQRSLSTRIPAL